MVRRSVWLIVASLVLAFAGLAKPSAQSDDLAALNSQAEALYQAGRFAEGIVISQRALALTERLRGPNHVDVGTAYNKLAVLYLQQGRYAEAEPLYKRALAIKEQAFGAEHTEVGTVLYGLAVLYVQQGRYGEAEPLYKRTLAIKERAVGPEHTEVGTVLYGLAALYAYLGRYEDAEPLYRRALAVKEKALGPDHSEVGSTLHNLAVLLAMQGRNQEAEPLYHRVVAIKERALGPDHTDVGSALYALAELYTEQGRYLDAEPIYRRVLAIKEKALGAEHTEVATALFGLAGLYADQGRTAEAEPLYKRVLGIKQTVLGPDHPEVGTTLNDLAAMHFKQGQWPTAADYWQQSAQVVLRRAKRGTETAGQQLTGKATSEAQRERGRFEGLIKASHRLAMLEATRAPELAREMFAMAQWSQSSQAATSLAQMAARQAKGSGALADLVRERQDLVEEWQARDQSLVTARAAPPDRRDAQREAAQSTRLAEIDGRLALIDKTLAKDFPEYATLADAQPLTIADVQALLRADEALLLLFDTRERQPAPEETFIWVVTKTQARWLKSEFGTQALANHVAALRCGLDNTAWDGDGEARCTGLLKTAGTPLPFDLDRAHELYKALFGQVEDLIKDKHLLIAAQGPLTALPFHVLVTEKPAQATPADAGGYADAAWLAKRHAVTVLPSVASLTALRQFAKASKATSPFIGFGNPLLVGPGGRDRRAWARQSCAATTPGAIQVARRGVRGTIAGFFRGGLADLDEVRAQFPLPETADELCAVAQSTGAGDAAVYLGERASETVIKALSADGTLARARVVHFATHGLLAGETEMLALSKAEPSLILTPPDKASEENDGLLRASEIAQMKLDADWVVLSACNTAAGESDKPGAEALSGLARAFFYAGARALLVSHWAVNSEATVKLVTNAFDQLKADPQIGRAEALRRSMLAMIARGGGYAHPATWAPFVVVGEGAR
jgi:CHAT domain-containing protein/Tfp pilus assembly protein PilF